MPVRVTFPRCLQALGLLLLVHTAWGSPKPEAGYFAGSWTVSANYASNEKVAVRENMTVEFEKNGTFSSTLNSIYYLQKTGKEVVWTTIGDEGKWTIEGDTLIFSYEDIEIIYMQSDIPSINEASIADSVEEQLETPRAHIIQQFSERSFTTLAGKAKYTFQKADGPLSF